jgi:hypothetical protein
MPTIAEPRDIYRTIEVVYPVIGAEEWQKSHNVRFLPDLVRITWKDGELQRVEMSGQRIYKTRRSFSDNRDSCSFYPSRFFGLDAAYSRSEPPAWLVEFVKEAECPE